MSTNQVDVLMGMKEKISKAKEDKAVADAELKAGKNQLKEEFNIETVEEIDKLIAENNDEIAKLEKILSDGVSNLKKSYDWETVNA